MTETEGVIKYHLEYIEAAAMDADILKELNAWRRILYLLGMTGQDPTRYGGLGFGNVSRRFPFTEETDNDSTTETFIISGTQTAQLPNLNNRHYVLVTTCDSLHNRIVAQGPIKPSSEALTHGAIYQTNPDVQFIFHVHSPVIWQHANTLGIPGTDANITYGTPEMARALQCLLADANLKSGSIVKMSGHEDGIISFGKTAEQAGSVLVRYLSLALQY